MTVEEGLKMVISGGIVSPGSKAAEAEGRRGWGPVGAAFGR